MTHGVPAVADAGERAGIRDAVRALCAKLGDDYWAERDRSGTLPSELHAAFPRGGWLATATA